jgi:hypothetical protein
MYKLWAMYFPSGEHTHDWYSDSTFGSQTIQSMGFSEKFAEDIENLRSRTEENLADSGIAGDSNRAIMEHILRDRLQLDRLVRLVHTRQERTNRKKQSGPLDQQITLVPPEDHAHAVDNLLRLPNPHVVFALNAPPIRQNYTFEEYGQTTEMLTQSAISNLVMATTCKEMGNPHAAWASAVYLMNVWQYLSYDQKTQLVEQFQNRWEKRAAHKEGLPLPANVMLWLESVVKKRASGEEDGQSEPAIGLYASHMQNMIKKGLGSHSNPPRETTDSTSANHERRNQVIVSLDKGTLEGDRTKMSHLVQLIGLTRNTMQALLNYERLVPALEARIEHPDTLNDNTLHILSCYDELTNLIDFFKIKYSDIRINRPNGKTSSLSEILDSVSTQSKHAYAEASNQVRARKGAY